MINAVFDTNVFLQAAVSNRGPAFACWRLVEQGIIAVYLTESILLEVEGVLSRPKIKRRFPILTNENIERAMSTFRFFSRYVGNVEQRVELDRDTDDEQFINLALTVRAEYLVSRDKDLLDLRYDTEFSLHFPSLSIVNPFEFLQSVRMK